MNYEQAKKYFYKNQQEMEQEFDFYEIDNLFSQIDTIISDIEDIKKRKRRKKRELKKALFYLLKNIPRQQQNTNTPKNSKTWAFFYFMNKYT